MESSQGSEIGCILSSKDRVESVIFNSLELGVKSQVAHGLVLVPEEVLEDIVKSLVEVPVPVLLVPFHFMSIDHPIDEGNDGVLEGDPLLGLWIEVEGHVSVSVDAHELVVQVEHWGKQWLLREVSVESCPIHILLIF